MGRGGTPFARVTQNWYPEPPAFRGDSYVRLPPASARLSDRLPARPLASKRSSLRVGDFLLVHTLARAVPGSSMELLTPQSVQVCLPPAFQVRAGFAQLVDGDPAFFRQLQEGADLPIMSFDAQAVR